MTEYCVLAITLCVPLYAYGVRGIWLYLLAGLICAGFAATDEYHQSSRPDVGRRCGMSASIRLEP